ncbi:MAG TPA: VWA domain-containing protein [Solirubrobacteraceae bacterium]|jgi:Ca-activated chloride channel family protein
MSFVWPLALVALIAIPLLVVWYLRQQGQRKRAAARFANPALAASFAPHRPGWRRHAPMIVFAVAIAALIVAAARPQRTVAVPITSGGIMLANDVSSSMTATDIRPTRLGAAQSAAERFVKGVPSGFKVGLMEFARRPILLQSPTSDHTLTLSAITQLHPGGGGTAVGETLQTALRVLTNLRQNSKRLPSAIVLLSDGASNVGTDPVAVAQQAKRQHIPIYTIALGTANGTIPITRKGHTVRVPVPLSSQELGQIARQSGGRSFTAADSAKASAVYAHLATQLGHKKVKDEITVSFAAGGMVLLLVGGVLSLFWFARLV